MKFQKMFRMQMMLVGLAAAFFFAGTVRAQEITNTEFPDGSNAVPFVQPASASATVPSTAELSSSQAMQAAQSISASASVQQAGVLQSKSSQLWIASTFLLCVGAGALYSRTPKREDRDPRKAIRARSMPLV